MIPEIDKKYQRNLYYKIIPACIVVFTIVWFKAPEYSFLYIIRGNVPLIGDVPGNWYDAGINFLLAFIVSIIIARLIFSSITGRTL